MEFFLDTADLNEIAELSELLPIDGVTTNPTILTKSGLAPEEFFPRLIDVLTPEQKIIAQVVATDFDGIMAEARTLARLRGGKNIVVKIPVTHEGYKAIRAAKAEGLTILATGKFGPGAGCWGARRRECGTLSKLTYHYEIESEPCMGTSLIPRDHYLEQALLFRDTDLIKVITGVRRCGKSCLMALVRERLESEDAEDRRFISLNLESMSSPITTYGDMYRYVRERVLLSGQNYVFIDEPQRIVGWQNAVNAIRVDFPCDIYLTGSNAYLLSSELSTYLSGRYVEVRMLPLSFSEWMDFRGIRFAAGKSVALDPNGEPVLFGDLFEQYLNYGGMPAIASSEVGQQAHCAYMASLYDAIATRDIINRERNRNQSRVTNPDLLRSIASFLADNVGNAMSAPGIAGALTSGGTKTSHVTVSSYVSALNEAYLFYRATRYDLHGKDILRNSPKQYIVDLGLRSYLEGYRVTDVGRLFENAVYLQLLFEGYDVHVGKLYDKEVDFVAIKDGQRIYLQVTDQMEDEVTRERELAALRSIRDAYPKAVVVRRGAYGTDVDGIRIVTAREFFLGRSL